MSHPRPFHVIGVLADGSRRTVVSFCQRDTAERALRLLAPVDGFRSFEIVDDAVASVAPPVGDAVDPKSSSTGRPNGLPEDQSEPSRKARGRRRRPGRATPLVSRQEGTSG